MEGLVILNSGCEILEEFRGGVLCFIDDLLAWNQL
jgi:hypothetical protein